MKLVGLVILLLSSSYLFVDCSNEKMSMILLSRIENNKNKITFFTVDVTKKNYSNKNLRF